MVGGRFSNFLEKTNVRDFLLQEFLTPGHGFALQETIQFIILTGLQLGKT